MVLMNLFAGQHQRRRCREQTLDTEGEGKGGMNWESNIETYISITNLKYLASGNLPYDIRNSKPVLCDNLEERDGVRGGREVQEGGGICVPMADSRWCMAEIKIIL